MRAIRVLRISQLPRLCHLCSILERHISARHQLILFYSFITAIDDYFRCPDVSCIEGPKYGFTDA